MFNFPQSQSHDGIYRFDVEFRSGLFEEVHVVRHNDSNWLSCDRSPYTIEITHLESREFTVIDRRDCSWQCDTYVHHTLADYVYHRMMSLRVEEHQRFRSDVDNLWQYQPN